MRSITIIALFIASISFGQDSLISIESVESIPAKSLKLPNILNLNGLVEDLSLGNDYLHTPDFNLSRHSFLKPLVVMQKQATVSKTKTKTIKFSPLTDFLGFVSESQNTEGEDKFGFRIGAGAS